MENITLPPLTEGASYYTLKEIAEWLKVSPQTLRNHCRQGLLSHYRFVDNIRVSPDQLRTYVRNAFQSAGH